MYRPWTGRQFGIEFEGVIPANRQRPGVDVRRQIQAALRRALGMAGVSESVGWRHTSGQGGQWDVKTDASVAYGAGFEVASPRITLDDQGHNADMRAALAEMAAEGARVDSTCGLHVSVDVSDFTWKEMQQLIALWVRYEPFFYSLLPASRRTGQWSSPMRAGTWAEAQRLKDGTGVSRWWSTVQQAVSATTQTRFNMATGTFSKYVSMRVDQWALQGRVEFRLHSGTLSYDKARKWTMLLIALVNRIKHPVPSTRKVDQSRPGLGFSARYVGKQIGLVGAASGALVADAAPEGAEVVEWCQRRQARFADQHQSA
jgi:hypothetical protein